MLGLAGLLTIAHLELEAAIEDRFEHILIPRAIVDELGIEREIASNFDARGFLGSIGGQPVLTTVKPEEIERRRALIRA